MKLIFTIWLLPVFTFAKWGSWFEYQYNSNVCSLGETEIKNFNNGIDDYGLATIDDDVISSAIWGESRFSIGRKSSNEKTQVKEKSSTSKKKSKSAPELRLAFGGRLVGTIYTRNFDKSSTLSQGWIKLLWGKLDADIQVSYIPRGATRPYTPLEGGKRKWAVYSNIEAKTSAGFLIVKNLSLGLSTRIKKYWYTKSFSNYNSLAFSCELWFKWYELSLSWDFTNSRADGRDMFEVTDISYTQDNFSLDYSRYVTIWQFKISPGIESNYSRRFYTSPKPLWIDPLHLGRWEKKWTISPQITVELGNNWTAKTKVEFSKRTAQSEWNPQLNGLRSYESTEISIRMSKRF